MPSAVATFKHDIKDRAKLNRQVHLAVDNIVDEFGGSSLKFKEGDDIVDFSFSIAGVKLTGEVLLFGDYIEVKVKLPLIGIAMKGMVIESLNKLVPPYLEEQY